MIKTPQHAALISELTSFYDSYDPEISKFEALMRETYDAHVQDHPEMIKTALMQTLAEKSRIHIFRHYPFWHEFNAGRPRKIWGGLNSTASGLYMFARCADSFVREYQEAIATDLKEGRIFGWHPVGLDHHALNYDRILHMGLSGLKACAENHRASCTDSSKLPFYNAVIESLDILHRLSVRFADEAAILATTTSDIESKTYYLSLSETARRIPWEPAQTFYEALAAIVFCRETVGTLEGIGISTYGHLDRMLYPYYKADMKSGRISREEAQSLIEKLLCYTAIRFDENNAPVETSTTIILGGCDANGEIVFNEVTELFIRAELNVRVANVKFDCRISREHPHKYIDSLIELQLAGLSMLVFMNDETHIQARVRHGQDVRDARLYVAGGCHEIVLGGTEVCTRADTWIGLPALLLDTLGKRDYDDFDDLYKEAIADVRAFHEKIAALKNKAEEHWAEFDPMPLYSSMLTGCLESGRDLTAGGSKYASTALSMLAPANFIDSLWAVKVICFDEKRLSVRELLDICNNNFKGNEPLRKYIVNRLPKHCSGNAELDKFSARTLHDLSTVSGQTNGRGGKYYPAFYPHELFRNMGAVTPATPDGRKKGFSLSRGVSPSEFLEGITPAHMLRTTAAIDFTDFTDSFALEMTLPKLDKERGMVVLGGIVKEFLKAGGSTLQFNLLNEEELREAQIKPEEHRDLLVRVCGYSFYFVNLRKEQQDEIIERAIR